MPETQIELARAALDRGDYPLALQLYLELAEFGDPEGQAQVGVLYQFFDEAIEPDFQKAEYWLKLAAQSGRSDAAHNLGTLYCIGAPGIPKDYKTAAYWYLKGRDLGANIAPAEWYIPMERGEWK